MRRAHSLVGRSALAIVRHRVNGKGNPVRYHSNPRHARSGENEPSTVGYVYALRRTCIRLTNQTNIRTDERKKFFFPFSEITINDVTVKAQDELTCGLGECVSVGVGVCNALEHPLSDLVLSINFYQDHHNGVNNYQLETRLSVAGANKVMLPAVSYGFYLTNAAFSARVSRLPRLSLDE